MKKLMIGNEAIARGLWEGGMKFMSSYPGTPSTEITECAAKFPEITCEWAPNEKVATEAVFGASLAGARAACAMKHVGLNVAADPLFTFSYTGVGGGAVICVADDPAMHSSQNEQDSRHYAVSAKLPMLEPADSADALAFARSAFDLSEKYDTPVLIRTVTRVAHSQSVVETGERAEVPLIPYRKNIAKNVMMPACAKARHPLVEERMKALTEIAEGPLYNRIEWGGTELGIITSGSSYQYVKEVFGDGVSILKLGMVNPLPEKLIRTFAEGVKKLAVVEELDGIIENHCHSLGLFPEGKNLFSPIGEFSQRTVAQSFGLPIPPSEKTETAVPGRPPMMCSGCPHRGVYYVLSKLKLTVMGDIGCYTLGAQPPLSAVDAVLCMGASVSGIHGFLKARPEKAKETVAVIGDSTFMHSGITGLTNIVYNGTPATVIILDNSITGMTGHQQNPTTGYDIYGNPAEKVDLEALCHAIGVKRVRIIDPYDLKATEEAIREETDADEVSVIISRRPCVLLKNVKAKPALRVDPAVCRTCKRCMSLGCPSIRISGGKVNIDATLCVGCGVCAELCPFSAIKSEEV